MDILPTSQIIFLFVAYRNLYLFQSNNFCLKETNVSKLHKIDQNNIAELVLYAWKKLDISVTRAVAIPNSILNTVYTGKTIFAFVRLDSNFGSVTTYRGIVGTGDSTLLRNINMYIAGSTPSTFQIHYSTSNGTTNYGSTSNLLTLTANQWCCVAVTQNAAGLVTYYFNGAAAGTNSHPLTQYNTTSAEYIGRNDTYWYGDIGTVIIYNNALSSAEILKNFNALRGRYSI